MDCLSHADFRGVIDTALKLTQLAADQLRERDLAGFIRLSNEAEKALVFLEFQWELTHTALDFVRSTRRELTEMQDKLLTLALKAKAIPTAGDA